MKHKYGLDGVDEQTQKKVLRVAVPFLYRKCDIIYSLFLNNMCHLAEISNFKKDAETIIRTKTGRLFFLGPHFLSTI